MMNPREVHDKLEALETRMRQLESERQQLIEALMGVHKIFGDEYKYDSSHRGAIMAKIKTALRDAGVEKP